METKDFSGIRNNKPLPAPSSVEIPSDIGDLLDEYIESTNSMLDELEGATRAYESGKDSEENAAIIRRVLHKIKGEAAMVGFEDISELCHQAEFAFEEIPEKERPDMVLQFKDWVSNAIQHFEL